MECNLVLSHVRQTLDSLKCVGIGREQIEFMCQNHPSNSSFSGLINHTPRHSVKLHQAEILF